MFTMRLCLFVTSLVFSNERFYVTEKRVILAQIGSEFYKSELVNSGNLVVDVDFFVTFLHKPF